MYIKKMTGYVIGSQIDSCYHYKKLSEQEPYRAFKPGRVYTLKEEQETWASENYRYILPPENYVPKNGIEKTANTPMTVF